MPVIRIVAALAVDDAGRVLVVRKRGTTAFMQPGGKPERGESPGAALVRELEEELGVRVDEAELVHLGRFDAPAANEAGHTVDAECYAVRLPADVAPHAEIEELRWVHPDDLGSIEAAPLLVDHMLPLLVGNAKE
ncbi:NUDIX domain-containing protein [Galbitalea sp. SE-J8]|uniref:NUDIX hydrolase n=1 Tax=Galbitalea sp. SE-J8 TaxID=3054952 RepID=UPI00259C866C|nr:NUDIX domain-containing protein [Galbitalea sp. SE-J8]MDM4762176.1 NUDIX domain-containing protein [Galbitalea sp. SE-J8]